MNRKEFLQEFRKHVRLLRESDRMLFELRIELMQHGYTACPFIMSEPSYQDSKEADYYHKYHIGGFNNIACQMVQVYCEEAKE